MREGVAQGDARRGGFDLFGGVGVVEHAGLGGHEKNLTQRARRAQRARRNKKEDRQECLSYQGGVGGADRSRFAGLRDCLESKEEKRELGSRTPRLLFGGGGFAGFDFGGGVGVFLGEAFDAAGGVNELLFAGEEGVAVRADFDVQLVALDGRASREIMAAGAVHRYGVIVGVNTGFHDAPFCRVRSARLSDMVGGLQPRR